MHTLRKVVFFSFVVFKLTSATYRGNESAKVVFVNVLHRHGDRTPNGFYPTDPYSDPAYWPEGVGQLTNLGKQQAYQLGQWLRKRYDSLLTARYDPGIIRVRSTDKDRTLMTVQIVLAGMYPPKGSQVWNNTITWQPIPVHTAPRNQDPVLSQPPRTPCAAYNQELDRVFQTDAEVRKLNQTYSELLRVSRENAKEDYNLLNIYTLYDALFVESLKNLTLPEWTKSVFPEPMREANLYNYKLVTWNKKLLRLTTGLLLQHMIVNMKDKAKGKTTRNVHIYSAHDETVMNLLKALDVFNDIVPPYVACLMMELQKDSVGDYYVSLFYRNSTRDEPYQLAMPGCTPVCPLNTFIDISQPVIPTDWDQECEITSPEDSSYLNKTVLVVVAISVVVILGVLTAYYCYYRRIFR